MQFVRQSKFRHVYCKPVKGELCAQDVRITKISWDSTFCTVNQKFLAVIVEGAGGPFLVIPVNKTGRIEKDHPVVDAHRGSCLDIAWCPFNDNVIASCSEDATAKVWMIPENGLSRTITEPVVELIGHQKRVQIVKWHPTASNVLLTAGGDQKILLWNVGTGEALIELAGHPDLIWSVCFNYIGSKIVTACKDRKIRVIDPRSGAVLQQGMGHEGMKPQQAIFTRDGKIFTTGFTKRSERLYALREESALEEPLLQEELDTSNGCMFPLYDPDTGLLYLCGKGDTAIRFYEVNNDPPFVHYIDTYVATEPQRGIAIMHKLAMNTKENEIDRIYKCTNKGKIEVLQFMVPRKSELFQDDLYPDTAGKKPALSAEDWINGADAEPIMVSMNPNSSETASKPKSIAKKANILADISAGPAAQSSAPSRREEPEPAPVHAPRAVPVKQSEPPAPRAVPVAVASAPAPVREEPSRLRDDVAEQSGFVLPRHSVADQVKMRQAAGNDDGSGTRWSERMSRLNNERNDETPRASMTTSRDMSRQSSETSNAPRGHDANLEELMQNMEKMKKLIRNHERRIRTLEEAVADNHINDMDAF